MEVPEKSPSKHYDDSSIFLESDEGNVHDLHMVELKKLTDNAENSIAGIDIKFKILKKNMKRIGQLVKIIDRKMNLDAFNQATGRRKRQSGVKYVKAPMKNDINEEKKKALNDLRKEIGKNNDIASNNKTAIDLISDFDKNLIVNLNDEISLADEKDASEIKDLIKIVITKTMKMNNILKNASNPSLEGHDCWDPPTL